MFLFFYNIKNKKKPSLTRQGFEKLTVSNHKVYIVMIMRIIFVVEVSSSLFKTI